MLDRLRNIAEMYENEREDHNRGYGGLCLVSNTNRMSQRSQSDDLACLCSATNVSLLTRSVIKRNAWQLQRKNKVGKTERNGRNGNMLMSIKRSVYLRTNFALLKVNHFL